MSEVLFLPPAWPLFTALRKTAATILVLAPYIFCYLAASSDPGFVTPANHPQHMTLYPYDFTIFYPGQSCSTCHLLKPARSKHCSICKHCVAKLDHHCIFINNCVGYCNQHWFLLLLLSTALLTTCATWFGVDLLWNEIMREFPSLGTSWIVIFKQSSWSRYFGLWAWALQNNTRMGAVTLLCMLTGPLIWGLLAYSIYLIWAGTTTNESMKWSDWQAEMLDGYVFKRKLPEDRLRDTNVESTWTRWPVHSKQIVVRTEDGFPPTGTDGMGVGEWERVWRLADIENLYDLGFLDNLADVFWPRYRLHSAEADDRQVLTTSSP